MTPGRQIRSDILMGAKAIAAELGISRQRVYRLAAQGRMPFFNIGNAVCARRSELLAWIAAQEQRNCRAEPAEADPKAGLSPSFEGG